MKGSSKVWLRAVGFFCVLFLLMPPASALASQSLRVLNLLPQGKAERITQVVVRFDRDMRPLGDMVQDAVSSPLIISPRPAGAYRWLDTRTLAYILDRPLVGASRLQIEVAKGTKALDGAVLPEAVYAAVHTPEVSIVDLHPKAGRTLGPRPQLLITINQSVDLESLAGCANFVVGKQRIGVKAVALARPGLRKEHLARKYGLTPVQDLPEGRQAVLEISPGVRPAKGDFPSSHTFRFSYPTYRPLRLAKWSMDQGHGGKSPRAALILEFTNPVSPKKVLKHLTLNPPAKFDPEHQGEAPTNYFYLEAGFKPRTGYELSLRPGLVDSYKTTMTEGLSLSFVTGDLPPIFSLLGGKGVLEAKNKPLYPLRLRNIDKIRAGFKVIPADSVVPELLAEDERPWDKKPPEMRPGPDTVTNEINFGLPSNQTRVYPLDLASLINRPLHGSIILMDLRTVWPDHKGKMQTHIQRAFVQITDLGLTLKLGEASGLVWATRLSTGQPLQGVKLELRDRLNRVIWNGVSGENGVARLPSLDKLNPAKDKKRPWKNPQVYLLARMGPDLAVLPAQWSEDIFYSLPRDLPRRNPGQEPALLAHAVTQLPLYQPSQTVRYVVYLRRPQPDGLDIPHMALVEVEITDSAGQPVHSFKDSLNAYGSLAGKFPLGPNARLGPHTLWIKVAGEAKVFAGSFRVASFRPPDFRVTLQAPSSVVGAGSGQKLEVETRYLFGAPVAQGKAKLEVEQQPAYFVPKRLSDFAVGDIPLPQEQPRLRKHLATINARLDKQGKIELKLPAAQPVPGFPVQVGLWVSVSDLSGRAVKSGKSYVAHPAGIYVGIKTSILTEAGKATELKVAAATVENKPVQSVEISLSAFREIWETVRERGPGGFWRYVGQARRTVAWRGKVIVNEHGAMAKFIPPDAGTYLIVAEVKDEAGRVNRSATYLYAIGASLAGWQRFDDHRLELKAQPTELKPGQTARILIQNPFHKATALITTERNGVRKVMIRKVEGPAPVVEIPVGREDAPNLFVGVLLVRGRVGDPGAQGVDLAKPQMRIGYAALSVRDPKAGLKVKITTDSEEKTPGATVRAQVQVQDAAGKAARTQVTFVAVDERVLTAAQGQNSYDLAETFYKKRPLTVINADSRTQVVGQRHVGSKGDDAGGGGGLGDALRREFHPAVYWLAQAETDENGRLEASFNLPGSLTAYRLVAIAADKGGNFGMGRAEVRASRSLQILSALPRFAVKGDKFEARVVVQNLSKEAGVVEIKAQCQGLSLTGPAQQRLKLAPGQSRAIGFAVKAAVLGKASFTVQAVMGKERDAAQFSLQVLPQVDMITAAAAGSLDPAKGVGLAKVPLTLPAGAQPGRGFLKVSVSPSLAAALGPPMDFLATYPWDCLEQRVSKAAGWAFRATQGRSWGFEPESGDKKYATDILSQVGEYQISSGGFTFWRGMSRADAMLTAYVLTAARQMARTGAALNPQVKKQAVDYLLRYLRRKPASKKNLILLDVGEALIIRALAKEGFDMKSFLESALYRIDGLSPFGLACLIDTAHTCKMPKVVDQLIVRLEASAVVSAEHLHFGTVNSRGLKAAMGSTLRGNAMALWALIGAKPHYPRLDALATWVSMRLAGERQLSTQEAVFGLWALAAYLERSKGGPVDVSLTLDGRGLAEKRFAGPRSEPLSVEISRDRLKAGRGQELEIKAQGQSRPTWTARLSYAPGMPSPKPVNSGLTLARFYRTVEGKAETAPKLGQEVECLLTLMVNDTRHHVLVQSPFPAGLEPMGAAGGAPVGGGQQDAHGPWQWKELRKTGLLLYADRLDPGVYTYRFRLRAVAPGEFMLRPARAEEMYAPEIFGSTAAGSLKVR